MSLKESILEIADDMDEESKGWDEEYGGDAAKQLKSFARQLRRVVKAAGDATPAQVKQQQILSPEIQHVIEIEKAKAEFRNKKKDGGLSEIPEEGISMRPCTGGPADGDMIESNPGMPVGARQMVGGAVYKMMQNGSLEYDEAETNRIGGEAKSRLILPPT